MMKRLLRCLLLRRWIQVVFLGFVCPLAAFPGVASLEPDGVDWPAFRGVNGSGVAEGFETATDWDVASGRNVAWETAIPGMGHSSPIVWGSSVFLTSAVSEQGDESLRVGVFGDIAAVEDDAEYEYRVLCVDKVTGGIRWSRVAHRGVPAIKRHSKASHANSTPATDGEVVVAFFGSEGLHAYDLEGRRLWRRDFGVLDSGYFRVPRAQWGFGSSPIIHNGAVIIQCDVQGDDFIAALSVTDGSTLWRTPRDEVPTWSTPVIYPGASGAQVVVNGYHQIAGYDAASGALRWQMEGGGDIPVATPVVGHGMVYITNHHGGATPIYAIRSPVDGASAGHEVVWEKKKEGAYLQTPIVYEDYLYISKYGILRCFRATDGELMYETRFRQNRFSEGLTPSPVAANGRVYFTSEQGTVYVLKAGPEFEIIEENSLNDLCMASPAISEGTLFFRTQSRLIAIADRGELP